MTFSEYFDTEKDDGFMKREGFLFRKRIDAIERLFHHTPFVFLHEELRGNMEGLLKDIEDYIGGRAPEIDEIATRRYNKSVGYYPAKFLRRLNRWTRSELNPDGRYDLNHGLLARMRLTPKAICQDWLRFVPDRPFLTPSQKGAIDGLYRKDWEHVLAYVASRRENAGRAVR